MYSRPSTAASSVDLAALASFPLPPSSSSSSSSPSSSYSNELAQTLPPWTAYRQTLPSSSPSLPPPPRVETPEEYLPHSEYFAATATPRRGSDNNLFEFDFDVYETPALSSSSFSSSRSHTSPFPSPTSSSSSSIDSELYNSPGRDKQDVGLGLWLEEQERKAAQMEKALSEFSISATSASPSTSYSSSWSQDVESTLPKFDPFGSASPVLVQRASCIKFEQIPSPPTQQRVHRPVPIHPSYSSSSSPQQTSLLPAAVISSSTSPHRREAPSPFSFTRPSYVAPGPEPHSPSSSSSSNGPLSPNELAQVAALHNGRVPSVEQMCPSQPVASNGLPPPIVNTGNQGRMVPQMGDWRCGTCTFVNWRRRKVCMRCFPFASNDIGQSFAAQSQRAAYLASTPMTPSRSTPSFPPAPPSSCGSSSFFSPPRKLSLPLPLPEMQHYQQQFSPDSYFAAAASSPQYSLPPVASPHYYHHQAHQHQQHYSPPAFPPRSPTEDLKLRRRIGGVIGYSGVAY
ncbi:zinc finger Ran-binding domain-containing protein [Sporobolomyces salmoneus]|uniref:zinc finger Ran-binding domain-containing protein n=1 Tax=Sporobolomyces salmoneus TaxID=183962 RepID=UPI00317142E0